MQRPYSFFLEEEQSETGELVEVATIFLTNRECPWHCLMCDLWKNTLPATVPVGAIPEQIRHALGELQKSERDGEARSAKCVKLYNNGSFFDSRAIPLDDYPAIAQLVLHFDRVIVECHPALVHERVLRFRDLLAGKLEVAMGLETAHPWVLKQLNKRMSLDQFARAAAFLRGHGVATRSFVLVKPPFMDEIEALEWGQRSIDFALGCGTSAISLIPVRLGNGALEALAALGQFSPPHLSTLERVGAYGIALRRARVFVDLWDLRQFSKCEDCFTSRLEQLEQMNKLQIVPPEVHCPSCGGTAGGVRPASS